MKKLFRKKKPDWARILEILYDENITVYESTRSSPEIRTDMLDLLVVRSEFDRDNVLDQLRYLEAVGLIDLHIATRNEERDELMALGGLTQEGLQIAHQINSERQRRLTNIILSGGILLVSFLTLAAMLL